MPARRTAWTRASQTGWRVSRAPPRGACRACSRRLGSEACPPPGFRSGPRRRTGASRADARRRPRPGTGTAPLARGRSPAGRPSPCSAATDVARQGARRRRAPPSRASKRDPRDPEGGSRRAGTKRGGASTRRTARPRLARAKARARATHTGPGQVAPPPFSRASLPPARRTTARRLCSGPLPCAPESTNSRAARRRRPPRRRPRRRARDATRATERAPRARRRRRARRRGRASSPRRNTR
mmetsp:Transcript_14675/g.62967  ORF Transcript_14675/g.62967 Transcript_14675/m.62967 type:complete len:241 (+) Transcript_14675:569-1291(+)